jgi:RIO kinase 2
MSYINGVSLPEAGDFEDAESVYWRIIEDVRKAFRDVGIVHGDLSEFNIMIDLDKGEPYIIDWPQWVPRNSVGALDLLRRDVLNVTRYFTRRFNLDVDFEEVFEYVTEGVEVGEKSLEEALEELIGSEGLNELMGSESEEEF